MKFTFSLFGLALVAMLVLSSSAKGCSCLDAGAPCQAFGNASAVFVGTVTNVKDATPPQPRNQEELAALRKNETYWTPRTFTFSVEQGFLNIDGTQVEVSTGRGGGDCGYDFKPGKRYLVYAYRSTQGNRLVASICSRTKLYETADEDIKFLGTLSSLSAGVTIYGEIKRQLHSIKRGDSRTADPFPDALLVVEGVDSRREVRADNQGRYRISGLQPGKYKVTLSLPEEVMVHRPEQEVTIADRGCASVNYFVTDNGRISGMVLDAEGQPVPKVLVSLIEADGQDIDRDHSKIERVDENGRYSFTAVPPGRYLLAMNVTRFQEPKDPTNAYPRTYYPGVAQASQATIISLGPGEKLTERDLRLPQRRSASVIKGVVMWADGTPVANAGISFKDVTYQDSYSNYGAQADELGRFTIDSYEGQTLVIEARSNRPYVGAGNPRNDPMERAEAVKITLANPSEVVKIVITKLR